MASPNIYDRLGGTSGARLAIRSPQYLSGVIWFIGPGGVDAAAPQGRERTYPLATLAQAHTNASAGDSLVFLSGHTETLTVSQVFNKGRLRILGEGNASNRPRFTCNGAIDMFSVSAAGVWFDNLYFPESGTAPASRILGNGNVGMRILNCQFDCGPNDTGPAVKLAAGTAYMDVVGTKFLSTATAPASRPNIAFHVSAINCNEITLDTVTFDGGQFGWSDYALKGSQSVAGLVAIDVDLLNGSDVYTASGSVYTFARRTATGSSHCDFTA